MTNYEWLKKMSIGDMAKYLYILQRVAASECARNSRNPEEVRKWLEEERT